MGLEDEIRKTRRERDDVEARAQDIDAKDVARVRSELAILAREISPILSKVQAPSYGHAQYDEGSRWREPVFKLTSWRCWQVTGWGLYLDSRGSFGWAPERYLSHKVVGVRSPREYHHFRETEKDIDRYNRAYARVQESVRRGGLSGLCKSPNLKSLPVVGSIRSVPDLYGEAQKSFFWHSGMLVCGTDLGEPESLKRAVTTYLASCDPA